MIAEAVVLLGAPRSGTTVLFETLGRHSALWSLGKESHGILEGPFHPSRRGWESNALGTGDLDGPTAARLRAAWLRRAQPGTVWRHREERRGGRDARSAGRRLAYAAARIGAALRKRVAPARLLEKTPKNCMRVGFLRALFPRVRFVFLRRDGRPTLSSLMDGWRKEGRYETYEVPAELRIGGYGGKEWCFVLPPGWRDLVAAPLEEVCAAQWLASVEPVLEALPGLRAEGIVHELSYEDLVAAPRAALEGILAFLGLPWQEALLPDGDALRVVNAVTPPDPDKWRRRNGEAIARVLPRIAAAQRALGYPA